MIRKIPVVILLCLCFASLSAAQEIKGAWAGLVEADDVFGSIRLDLDESKIVLSFAGNELTGAIKNLKITNGEISFTAELRPRANFSGKIENGKINGTFELLRSDGTKSGSGVWEARKVDSLEFKGDSKAAVPNETPTLPQPTGKYAIGRKFFYWTDESRAETITDDADDKRKLFVQLWYPANKGGKQPAEYLPNFAELRGADKDSAWIREIKTHAFQDAKPAKAKTKFPVLIFSPGLGSNPFFYGAIIENLVSRGYVVAAINHPFDTDDFKFSDGNIIRYAKEKWSREISKDWTQEQRRQFFDERRFGWAKDISFVVNQLEKLEKPFKGALDLQNLGVFGHSFGGQATSIACASDARFKACANLDGMAQGSVVLPNEKGEIMKQPFLFFNKADEVTDAELKIMNLTRVEYRARERRRLTEKWKPSFKNRMAEIESGAYFILYPGVKHSSFSDSLLTSDKDVLYTERFTIAQNINDYLLAFFDKFLRQKSSDLLDGRNQSRPPIVVEFLKKNK